MDYNTFKQKLLQNPEYVKEVSKTDLRFEISQMIIDARVMRGITQKKLAKLAGTKQPSIARLESGSMLPSLTFLEKIAKALKTDLIPPKFTLTENYKLKTHSQSSQSIENFSTFNYQHWTIHTPEFFSSTKEHTSCLS